MHLANIALLGHPSVKHSYSAGAIGILGVKKTVDGVCLYFAHNTDSFVSLSILRKCSQLAKREQAVASMATSDKDPRSVMSRGKGDSKVTTGARMVKHHRWASMASHRETWPENPDGAVDPAKSAIKRQKKKRHTAEKLGGPYNRQIFTPSEKRILDDPDSATHEDVNRLKEKYKAAPVAKVRCEDQLFNSTRIAGAAGAGATPSCGYGGGGC